MNPGYNFITNMAGSYTGYLPIDPTFPNLAPRELKAQTNVASRQLFLEQRLPASIHQWLTNASGASLLNDPFVCGCRLSAPSWPPLELSCHAWGYMLEPIELSVAWHTLKPEAVFTRTIAMPVSPSLPTEWCSNFASVNVRVTVNSTNLAEHRDLLFESTKTFLEVLAEDYVAGKIDIPDIARQLGDHWTEGKVVELLEQLGAYRPISALMLTASERDNILAYLAKMRGTAQAKKLIADRRSIEREVIASQRIESVHVEPEDLTGE